MAAYGGTCGRHLNTSARFASGDPLETHGRPRVTRAHRQAGVKMLCVNILGVGVAELLGVPIVLPEPEQLLEPHRLPRLQHPHHGLDVG
jgi:hypothetical protein